MIRISVHVVCLCPCLIYLYCCCFLTTPTARFVVIPFFLHKIIVCSPDEVSSGLKGPFSEQLIEDTYFPQCSCFQARDYKQRQLFLYRKMHSETLCENGEFRFTAPVLKAVHSAVNCSHSSCYEWNRVWTYSTSRSRSP